MHKWAKEIAECLRNKVDEIGVDSINGACLEDFKNWSEIIKNIASFDYHYNIVDAMEKSEYGEDYDEWGAYKYYTPRMGKRRMYRDDYVMTPERYRAGLGEEWRDYDRKDGRMYYTHTPEMSEHDGHSYMSRREFMEFKESNPEMTDDDKLESYMRDLSDDISEMVLKMTPSEKQMLRNKLNMLTSRI